MNEEELDPLQMCVKSLIYDDRYYYIIDYINEVLNYQMNNPDLITDLTIMKSLADTYIKEHLSKGPVKNLK